MPQYRKKPVVIEAQQLTRESFDDVYNWIEDNGGYTNDGTSEQECYIGIETLEGDMSARNGDYIIRGVQGEFYPCKPDIFEETYELVEG